MNMKRKSIVTFVSVLCVAAALCGMLFMLWVSNKTETASAVETHGENNETREPVAPTASQQERWEWTEKPYNPFQLRGSGTHLYTFGQASKFCDWVVVGTIEKVKLIEDYRFYEGLTGHLTVLSVDACLYGKHPGKKMTFMIADVQIGFTPTDLERRVAQPGDRVLAFITDRWYCLSNLIGGDPITSFLFFDFDRSKVKQEKTSVPYVRSYMILDDKTAEEEAIRVATGYLEVFGEKGHRDRDKYIEFLCSLLNSPVQRIGDDAERDLILFCYNEKDPLPDFDKLLADDRVRKEVKDYLRSRLRNEKPKEE